MGSVIEHRLDDGDPLGCWLNSTLTEQLYRILHMQILKITLENIKAWIASKGGYRNTNTKARRNPVLCYWGDLHRALRLTFCAMSRQLLR
jgi:hypothetical protein